ncbi:MAG TPA: DUF1800 domain-containing protein [Vicinamibacteria bacterium]|nr:DUF1800 domain-containing protein [Vicinamibacteria bacterium]
MGDHMSASLAASRRGVLRGLGGGALLAASGGAVAQDLTERSTGSAGPSPFLGSPERREDFAAAARVEAEQPAAVTPPASVIALNRLAFGPRPGELAEFDAMGSSDAERLQNWVDWQLDPAGIDDSALAARLSPANGFLTLHKTITELWADHVLNSGSDYNLRMRPIAETERATFVRAMYSRRQLFEVLAGFWHDHFNVYGWDYTAGPMFVHYDRDVIRAHALGNFRQMLEAVAKSPSMLYYLDNYTSTNGGPNENYARELLELHTLGAENYYGVISPFLVPQDPQGIPLGYVDVDVYEASRCFTGWTLKNGHWQYPADNDGTFVYRAAWHDRFNKFFVGLYLVPDQPAMKDGHDVFDRLASHGGTAHFVAKKLCRRLVGDNPPEALVQSAAGVFRANVAAPDQLKQVVRHIVLASSLLSTWGQKTKRPFEAVVGALRGGGAELTLRVGHALSDSFGWRFQMTGHRPHYWPAPNGYPDLGTAWQGTSSLAMTWKMLDWLVEMKDGSAFPMDVLAQTLAAFPQASQRPAAGLVDFWLGRMLGYQPDSTQRQRMVAFLAQNGAPTDPIDLTTDAWSSQPRNHYNQSRLRTTVSMILLSPEFLRR